MNSSSVPASATQPRSAQRSSCFCRIARGDWTTGLCCPEPSGGQTRSHWTIAVDGRWVRRRMVRSSRMNSMSPYPFSQEEMA
jgi:hypothetical protein